MFDRLLLVGIGGSSHAESPPARKAQMQRSRARKATNSWLPRCRPLRPPRRSGWLANKFQSEGGWCENQLADADWAAALMAGRMTVSGALRKAMGGNWAHRSRAYLPNGRPLGLLQDQQFPFDHSFAVHLLTDSVLVVRNTQGESMTLRKLIPGSVIAVAAAGMILLAVTSVEAAMLLAPPAGLSTSEAQLAAEDCGAGFHRNTAGICIHNAIHTAMPRRHCQPGLHAISFPNGAGYRCVPN